MEILKTLNRSLSQNNIDYVVIGGHAIIAHGYARSTTDIDLAVQSSDRDIWIKLLENLGYKVDFETSGFVNFKSPRIEFWKIDLMLVNNDTFTKLIEQSKKFQFRDAQAKIASIQHLISMKLHALKSLQEDRKFKDLDDLINLLKIAKIPLSSENFRLMCQKYGNIKIYEEINEKHT